MKIKDKKRLVEITLRVWSNGQYSQDLSVGLLVDGSFEYEQGACKVDNVDDVIDYAFDWQNCTGDFIEDEDPDNNRRVDVDIISDSSHEKPYDEFTARAQQAKSDALVTGEAASLFDGGWRSGDKLSKYIRKLVISQMQLDNLLIGENGDLFPGSGGTVNKELKQINDYTIFHLGPVPNEVCTWEQMEKRIDHLIFEMLH